MATTNEVKKHWTDIKTRTSAGSNSALKVGEAGEAIVDLISEKLSNTSGWSPVLAVVNDNDREVLQIKDWTGGTGTKPPAGYLGTTGVVASIAQAVNIKGSNWGEWTEDNEFLTTITDNNLKILFALTKEGTPYFPENEMYYLQEDVENRLQLTVDSTNKIIEYIDQEGVKVNQILEVKQELRLSNQALDKLIEQIKERELEKGL